MFVAAFADALLGSSVHQQGGGVVGVMTPSSTAISTEILAIVGESLNEGVDVSVSTAMECVVLSHSHICSFVEHEKYPKKLLDPTRGMR